jgi:hypothetical protein
MIVNPCPTPHCGGSLWNEGERVVCSQCSRVTEDLTTFREHFARTNVPTVSAYRAMQATGSHSRRFPTESMTDGLLERTV